MSRLVLSTAAAIRFRDGKAVVDSAQAGEAALETDDAAVIAFVARFAVPQDPFEALRALPASLRPAAEDVLGRLVQKRVLLSVDAAAPAGDAATEHRDAILGLRMLSRVAGLLAEDVAVLGPAAAQPAQAGGLPLERRLYGLHAALDTVREDLRRVRDARLAAQTEALFARHGRAGLALHMAAGQPGLPGWVNINAVPADLALNPRWGLPFAAGSARRMFVHHVLERLEPAEREAFLRECRRVLEPGGTLRLAAGAAVGSPGALLGVAGFATARESTFMGSADAALRVDEVARGAGEVAVYWEADA